MNTLFQNVLTASFHGSIVITAVILLRLALKKAPRKFICLLWLLAGVRLLMPFEIQSDFSLQPEIPVAEVQVQQASPEFMPVPGDREEIILDTPAAEVQTPVFGTPAQENTPVQNPQPKVSQTVTAPEEKEPFDWTAVIPYIWLTVACGFAVYSLISYLSLKRKVRFSVKIPGGWECDRIDTAFILGFIRPKIYIPMGMSPIVRKHILAHERTHLEKGDHWFKMIGFLALALHWFNPLVWVAYILLCKDIEMACDERVVQFMELEERKEYSAALLSCSTNRAHFAACPVAFGEVSVKERIKSVLNYKKPSFWISLVGVIAIVFVAVCLVTSPVGEPENAVNTPAAGETMPAEDYVNEDGTGFASNLSESEIAYTCEQAIEELKSRESYYIHVDYATESTNEYYGSYISATDTRRHGENKLSEPKEDGELMVGGSLRYNGMSGSFWGDRWVWDGAIGDGSSGVDDWLDSYSPNGKEVSFPEGTGVVSGDTVSFHAQWTESNPWEQQFSGTISFTFHKNGTIASISKDCVYPVSEEDGGGEVRYTYKLTVMEESVEDTDAAIQAVADQTITQEELDEYRLLQDQVTEVPSNKTQFDKDFSLGAGQMGWKFMKGEWFFKFGAVDVTETGCRLLVEYNGSYGNNTISSGTVTSGDTYFLEELVDGVWTTVPTISDTFTTIAQKSLPVGASQTINWEANYGSLPGGFYRIGNYYTFTGPDGKTDTQVCYAKFRIYDPNHVALLSKCRAAIDALMNSDSYHLYTFDWMREHDFEYYLSNEVWKHGPDYLEVTRYPLRENMSEMRNVRGSMWRNGKYYGLGWSGEPAISDVNDWWIGVDGYMDDSGFDMWSCGFEWYDANVELVYQDGDQIHILENYSYSDQYQCTELILSFDKDGNLKGIVSAYLPNRNCAEKDKIIREELVVYDTKASEIETLIYNQDVATAMAFSYAEDVKNNPNAQTSGFKNTTAKTITTAAEAIALADKESTMPKLMEFENGYCQSKAYYDETAKMWKVELFWWQHDTAQTIYMNDQGITQMIVSVE